MILICIQVAVWIFHAGRGAVMNKVYQVIWSRVRHCYMAVAETVARSHYCLLYTSPSPRDRG